MRKSRAEDSREKLARVQAVVDKMLANSEWIRVSDVSRRARVSRAFIYGPARELVIPPRDQQNRQGFP